MKITPLSAVGAEVTEVDVTVLTAVQDAQLKAAFAQHGLLIFRDQDLTEADHIGLAERWGQINTNRFFKAHADYPQIALVDKTPDQIQNIGGDWHTDHSYDQVPALGSILVAQVLPETGGDTWFASMYRAFDQLSEGLKTLLLTLNAVHSAKHVCLATSLSICKPMLARKECIGRIWPMPCRTPFILLWSGIL